MSKYYIYRQHTNIDSYHYTRYAGDNVACTIVKDPATNEVIRSYDFCVLGSGWRNWRYSLSKTRGTFFGEGSFCGYYAYSGWRNCKIIADEIFDVDGEGNISAVFVEYKEPVTYHVSDTYSMPEEVEFETDEEAIKYFVESCTKEFEGDKNE